MISLLEIVQSNIVLLDPRDEESQKSKTIAEFKAQIVESLKAVDDKSEGAFLKDILDKDISEDLVDILQKQFIDSLITIKSYNQR